MQELFGNQPRVRAVRVLVDGRDDMVLDYALLPGTDSIERGCRVEIPLRGGKAVGTVLQTVEPEDAQGYRLRPILRTVDDQPIVSPVLLDLAEWAANYYAVPVEQMIRCIVPEAVRQERHEEKTRKVLELLSFPDDEQLNKINARAPRQASILRYLHNSPDKRAPLSDLGGSPALTPARSLAKQGLVRICEETVHRDPAAGENFAPTSPLELNEEQAAALAKINEAFDAGDTRPILLQGVTGSGKTEVYLQAAARTMAAGKGVLILVPEISLTPQTMARFKSRFADTPGAVAILHSAMSDGERFDEWHAIRRGKARIAIGPRSAVFAPVQQLGLIIVDEEHDASYKQENSPRYQGRDLAVVRAKMEGATIVLGSATPSLESLHNAQIGKYSMLRLDHRADGQRLPLTRVLDMRTEPKDKRYQGILSERLRMAIDERLQSGEQTILLLNRRGFARALQCPDCGHIVTCEHCSLPMTYHLTENRLICHICGYRAAVPHECPACHSRGILLEGCGTQKVEAILRRCYPQARLQRVDADVAARKNALRDILADFRAHRIDILLGTQMISKGLDFPGVTLVGVLNADIGLSIPDPRAGERSFQLLTQVAGRAGRGDLDGEVIIQTFTPQAAAIQFARRHDTDGFAESELALRRQFGYPPFSHMAVLTVRSATEDLARLGIETLHRRLSDALPANVNLSPPIPSPIAKSYGQYRFQCTLSAPSARPIATHCSREIAAMNFGEDIIATLDTDAYTFS